MPRASYSANSLGRARAADVAHTAGDQTPNLGRIAGGSARTAGSGSSGRGGGEGDGAGGAGSAAAAPCHAGQATTRCAGTVADGTGE
jgi:hypothetical protein